MIKKIMLLVFSVSLAFAGYSQTLPAERVVVSESIILRKQPIDTIAQDTSYATLLRTRAIPSMAVIRQMLNRMSTAAGITNIGQGTPNSNNISITSSSGTGTTLLAATQTVAGIMSALDKFYLDSSIQSLEVSNDTLYFVKRGVRTFGVVLPGGFDVGALRQVLNLADLTDVAVARQNLGLGSGALLDTAATGDAGANQLVKGNDSRLTGGRVPTGPAGGDLTGTYPNPTLTNTGVTPGLYTNANVAVDAKGRIIGISSGAGNPGDTTVYITPGANISVTGIGASYNPYIIAGKNFVDSVNRSNDSVYYWIAGVKTFGFLDRGTVSNISSGFGIAGGPITTTGTLALDSSSAGLKSYILKYGTDSSWVYVNYLPQDPATVAHSEGRLFYDNDNKTLTLYDNQVGTSIQIGKENIIDARNNTGSTILDGQVVRITGATGSNPTIGLAKGSTPDSAQVVGLATHNISNGTTGKVVTFGLLNDVNTSAFTEGDALWLSATTAGAVTNVQPGYPNIAVFLGYVLRSHASQGKILVTPERGQRGGDTLIFENGLVDVDHTPLVRAINDTTVEVATIGVLPGIFTTVVKDSVAGQRDWTVNLDTASTGLKDYVSPRKSGDTLFFPNGDTVLLGTVNSTGYAIAGNGSAANPLRVDSATLRGDYIRNQYSAQEGKRAWFSGIQTDSSRFGRIQMTGIDINPADQDELFNVTRTISSGTGNSRTIYDQSTISRSGNIAHASFDGRVTFSGGIAFDHYAAHQSIPTIDGTSTTLGLHYGLFDRPIVNSGATITNRRGIHIGEVTGTGSVTNNVGVYIDEFLKGTTRYGIYSRGGINYFSSRITNASEDLIEVRKHGFNPNALNSIKFNMGDLVTGRVSLRGTSASVGDLVFDANGVRVAEFLNSGYVKFNGYGSGTKTGTAAYFPAFDAAGNLIETTGTVVINNNTNNYVLTASGSANTINGESALIFNGTTLKDSINGAGTNVEVQHFDANRVQGALNGGLRMTTFVNAGGTTITARLSPYNVLAAELVGSWTTTVDHSVTGNLNITKLRRTNNNPQYEALANDGNGYTHQFFGTGRTVTTPASNPIAIIDPEGRLQIGSKATLNHSAILDMEARNRWMAVQMPTIETVAGLDSIQGVKAIYVGVQGSGYTSATISFTGGGGTGLAATVSVAGGRVTGVTITNFGSGYTSAPSATISGDGTLAEANCQFGALRPGMSVYVVSEGAIFTWNGTRWNANRYNGTKFQGWDDSTDTWVVLN